MNARRILAIAEDRPTDAAVVSRAVAAAEASGGYLTLVAIACGPVYNPSPYCFPQASAETRHAEAAALLRRLAALVPQEIPLTIAVDEGRVADVIARRVETAAHDLVVVRRSRIRFRRRLASLLAVTA
jgi:hypothetical protein